MQNTKFDGPELHAYMSAAGYVAALYDGLVPRTVSFEDEIIRDDIPLYPDDVLREWPIHLAEASTHYSEARIARMVEQGLWSAGMSASRLLAAQFLVDHDLSIGPPPAPSREQMETTLERTSRWLIDEAGCVCGGEPRYHNRDGADRADQELEQIFSRLMLLAGWDGDERVRKIEGCFRSALRVLVTYWETLCSLAAHLIYIGPVTETIALALGERLLDGRFAGDADYRALARYCREQVRIARAYDDAWRIASELIDRDITAGPEMPDLLAAVRQSEDNEFSSLPLALEPALRPANLTGESRIHRAARFFLAFYNGGYVKIANGTELHEVLPYRYVAFPLLWLERNEHHIPDNLRSRLLEESAWEIEALAAGFIADRYVQGAAEDVDVAAVLNHIRQSTQREVLMRPTILADGATALEELFQRAVRASADHVNQYWSEIQKLAEMIQQGHPTEELLAALAPFRGLRHHDCPQVALLCDYVRERVLSDSLRAVVDDPDEDP